jgi:hypothetical protein
MPITKDGVRADIISDPTATSNRMNIGRLYETYISGGSRKTQLLVREELTRINPTQPFSQTIDLLNEASTHMLYNLVLNFLSIFESPQYYAYLSLTNIEDKKLILREVAEKELYVQYTGTGDKQVAAIICQIQESIYAPLRDKVTFRTSGKEVTTKEDILITPMYTMLLAKIADTVLTTSSSKTNHYGFPVGVSKFDKYRLSYRSNPVRVLSETETRLYASHVGLYFISMLKDVANSPTTHREAYRRLLTVERPTNIDQIVDREKFPLGNDPTLDFISSVFNATGLSIGHHSDLNKIYPMVGSVIEEIQEISETKEEE